VTGAGRRPDFAATAERVAELRVCAGPPVAVGFGIATADDVRATARFADGAIVGSALIDACAGTRGAQAARRAAAFVQAIRAGSP
jgi:tryptophan synthase alpha chain